MTCVVEIVKMVGGDVVSDEFFELALCPSCGAEVPDAYLYCPHCGGGPLEGGTRPSCENKSDNDSFFLCSNCGRLYVPVQVKGNGEGGAVDWKCCPGCMAVVG